MIRYKLTDQQYRTRAGARNEALWRNPDGTLPTVHATGSGDKLCSDGVIHSYASPELAAFMNPVHASITNPLCIEIETGPLVADDGTKGGHKWARMVRVVPLPVPTQRQRVIFAILAVRAIPGRAPIPVWDDWVDQYLKGAADAAAYAAAYAAANAAANAAADAAAYAANAAAYAADAANAAAYAANAAYAAAYAANAANAAAYAAIINFNAIAQQAMNHP